MKNLILTVAANYNFYHLFRFVKSLERTGYTGDVVIFLASNSGARTKNALEKNGVRCLFFDPVYPYYAGLRDLGMEGLKRPMHIFNYRHLMFHDFLTRSENKYERVMIADSRDVYFQRNPFDFEWTNGLHCAIESKKIKFRESKVNVDWLIAGFGRQALDVVGDSYISCAGTIFGDIETIKEYETKMLNQIARLENPFKCIDQAIHNLLIYSKLVEPTFFIENESGHVLTMALMDKVSLNKDDEVINELGMVVNTLHQYDRHKEVDEVISQKLFGSKFQKNWLKLSYKVWS